MSENNVSLLNMAVTDFKRQMTDATHRGRRHCRVFENATPFYDRTKNKSQTLRWVHVILNTLNKDALTDVLHTCLLELMPCKCKHTRCDVFENDPDKTTFYISLCLSKKEPSHRIVADFLNALHVFDDLIVTSTLS